MMDCLDWIFESWKITARDYSSQILEDKYIEEQIKNEGFDFSNGVIDLDITIIGTAFGQLILEGKIDEEIKPFINLALERQLHPLVLEFDVPDKYLESRIEYIQKLKDILQKV